MDTLSVEPGYRALLRANGVQSCADLVAWVVSGENAPENWDDRGHRVLVRACELQDPDGGEPVKVHCKIYQHRRPTSRFILRRSKARIEHRNLGAMREIGLPVPDRVAWAESRTAIGRLRCACIITVTLPDVVPLDQYLAWRPPETSGAARRRRIIERLARQVARAHRACFFHHDLFPRNILVAPDAAEAPPLSWIDAPRGRFDRTPLRRRRMLKDLACLDKHARHHCSRAERLRFLMRYLQRDRVDHEVRSLATRVTGYVDRRWRPAAAPPRPGTTSSARRPDASSKLSDFIQNRPLT